MRKIGLRTEKKCAKCGLIKPLSEFHKNCESADGRVYNCKKCSNHPRIINRNPVEKTCSMCKKIKPVSEFHKESGSSDGYRSNCKACAYTPNPRKPIPLLTEKVCNICKILKPASEFYQQDNRLHYACKTCFSKNIEENKFKIKLNNTSDRIRQLILDTPFKICKKCGESKTISNYQIKRSRKDGIDPQCKECRSKTRNAKYDNHKDLPPAEYELWRLERKKQSKIVNDNLKHEVLAHYCPGGIVKCQDPYHIHDCLVITDLHLLTLDHINGDGHKELNKYGHRFGGRVFYRWLRMNDYPRDDLQVLCILCQFEKAYRNKEYSGRKNIPKNP